MTNDNGLLSLIPNPTAKELVEDESGASEELSFRKGLNLRDEKTKAKIKKILRDDRFDSAIDFIFLLGLRLIAFMALLMFIVFSLHYILPQPYRWLNEKDLEQLKQFLFSGTIGGAITYLGKNKIIK